MTGPTDAQASKRRCILCGAASLAECAGGLDPRRTFAEPCGPFVSTVASPPEDLAAREAERIGKEAK